MPSLPLVTRTGLIDKRRGSKAHTAISEVHVGPASSTVHGVTQRSSWSKHNHLVFPGDLAIPRGNHLGQQQVLKRRWSAIVQGRAVHFGAIGTFSLKRKRSTSFGSISDIALRRPLKRMRILEGPTLPGVYDVWELRALLRRQDSDQSRPRPRRRRRSPVRPPPSCFQQAAHSSNGDPPCNSKPQPSHSYRRRPSSLVQVPRSCVEQAAAQSEPSFSAADSADGLPSPKKSRAHRRKACPQVPTSVFQQGSQAATTAMVPGDSPRSSRSSRRKQVSRPPTSCFHLESAGDLPSEVDGSQHEAGPQHAAGPMPVAHANPTALMTLEGGQTAGSSTCQLRAQHSILPVMVAKPGHSAESDFHSQPEVSASMDAAVMPNFIGPACSAASEPNNATHDASAPPQSGFSFQQPLPASRTSLPGFLPASTWWMPQVGADHQELADIQPADHQGRPGSAEAGIQQEIDACFPELSASPASTLSSTTQTSSNAASHFDGDAYLFRDGSSYYAPTGPCPADQFDGDAYLFKGASSGTLPTHASPAITLPDLAKSSSLFSFQPVHAADTASVYSWPFCFSTAPLAHA